MISEIVLNYHETADLLDDLFPWECWYSNLENIIKGDMNGLPKIRFTICPDGPNFHLSSIATFALKFAGMNQFTAADFVESILENFILDRQVAGDDELDDLLVELTGGDVA